MIASMRNSWAAAAVWALLAGACSSGEQNRAPAASDGGSGGSASGASGGKGSGASPSKAGDGGEPNVDTPQGGGGAAAGGEAGEAPVAGGPGTDGGAENQNGGGAGGEPPYVEPFPDPVCLGSAELSDPIKLPISTLDDDQLGGVTADELVIAWTVVTVDKVTLHYAKRADKAGDFGDEGTLELAQAADDSITISPDGLRVVYVNSDRKGFTQLVRESLTDPFGTVDNRDFVPIAESIQDYGADELVGDPVLGQDGSTFFYSHYGAGRTKTLLRTLRFSSGAPWPPGAELAVTSSLEASDDERQRPTGVSVDNQALFVWDNAAGSQKVALLDHDTATYDVAFELDDAHGAAPNGACSRVYFDRDGDLWTAELR